MFLDPNALSLFDEQHSEEEERWITLGLDQTGALLVISHTYHDETENSARVRLIRDHDHCEFCWAKFMVEDYPDVLHEGYSTLDEYRWVCKGCFEDFKESFQWRVNPVSGS